MNLYPAHVMEFWKKMDWRTHLIFNIITVLLAAIVFILQKSDTRKNVIRSILELLGLAIISGVAIIILYQCSEFMIKKENNFTRRFLQHPIKEDARANLGYNSYDLAGGTKDFIYLGNYTTPFTLTSLDIDFIKTKEMRVVPDSYKFQFKRAQFQVNASEYYLFDGTVPIIYHGIIGSKKAQTLNYGQAYFSQLINKDQNTFAISTFYEPKKIQALGLLFSKENKNLLIKTELLKKRNDPVFDTDGQLHYDYDNHQFVYMHYYKNQFIVMDENLNLKGTFKTIDTFAQPKITISELSD